MCFCLPCCGATVWASWKVTRQVDKAFSSSSKQTRKVDTEDEEIRREVAVAAEQKLARKVQKRTTFSKSRKGQTKSFTGTRGSSAAVRFTESNRSLSLKEAESRARLQELIGKHTIDRPGK